MLKKFVRLFGGDPNKRAIEKHIDIVEQINAREAEFEALSDDALRAKTGEFRAHLAENLEDIEDAAERAKVEQTVLNDLLPEAFAAVREASKRTIGLRHYDVQLIGGIALHSGQIAEMRTGEGKTLVATLPLYLNAITGRGIHLITVNDYLARRDARWMAPIFNALGLTVGVLQMASRTENGKKAFVIELEKRSPHEDQDQLRLGPRAEAYAADITYGTNSEFGFDYLRDNMTMRWDERVQRGHYYAIVDEVDNVLIDEARTPLIISGPAAENTEWYYRMAQIAKQLRVEDYEINEHDRNITLTELGDAHVEELLGIPLRDPDRPEDVTPEQARIMGHLEQALRAQYLYRRNKDYLVQAGKVIIVDEFTGRLMPGRRWSDGLHQAVEAKEGVHVEAESVTYATITIQNYFRMYQKLAGMSGTAVTEAEEFDKIYKLGVLAIPTNLEYQAFAADAPLVELDGRDEAGYKYHYYTRRDDPQKKPVFYRRKDYPDVIFRTEEAKFRAITQEILRNHVLGRPMLVGTTSVELSERLSNRLRAEPLRRLAQVMLIRERWIEKYNIPEDGRLIAELQPLNAPLDTLDTAQMRKMARDLEISFSPEEPSNCERLLAQLDARQAEAKRLVAGLQGGIAHEVLNARKHTEESQIIAGAGAFGAVTIATNMAGRGVDIKLGGELAEEIIATVNRVLRKAGFPDPYDMSHIERRLALQAMNPADFGIYDTEVKYFLQHLTEMQSVRDLGGLHIIGSERHEARRIDNQLRGRAARQGDPGSSRFYLSMEDELMRRFGGDQAKGMMERLKVDDALPLEIGIVSRLVEQSQTRVEGANFDVRKHLLEYDDVLNKQRGSIYLQRDRIFVKDDLSDDVSDMLHAEVNRRVPEAMADPEGPWKLLAWLDQVQPSLQFSNTIYPSFTLKLLLDQVLSQLPPIQNGAPTQVTPSNVRNALLAVAGDSLKAEETHLKRSVETLLEQSEERLDSQKKERLDALDTFFEGLSLGEGEGEDNRSPRELGEALAQSIRLPVRLSPESLRTLRDDPRAVKAEVRQQVEAAVQSQAAARLVGAIERRLEESLNLNPAELPTDDWRGLSDLILDAIARTQTQRRERLLGSDGQIAKDLESALDKIGNRITGDHLINLLVYMPQGTRTTFDRKTHRRTMQRTTRLIYTYYAASLLENRSTDDIAEMVLTHLEKAQKAIHLAIGASEWMRLSNNCPNELDEATRQALHDALGDQRYEAVQNQPLQSHDSETRSAVATELGRRNLNETYRQLMLGVITELWVDYLTQMEALRVSIGLEAYAQRDPLVQYKSRASGLFQELLKNMRVGVVSRMFTYRPRNLSATLSNSTDQPNNEVEAEAAEEVVDEATSEESETSSAQPEPAGNNQPGKKKRRRRH